MKAILNRLIEHENLSKSEAKQIIINIANGQYNGSQIASFLTVYMMRTISLQELEGFREALLELCIHIDLSEFDTIDLCGTGGDGKDTFNISTLSSFVTAGAGVKVSKHGNYGVSSGCGSSNVLEEIGIRFSNDADFLKRCIDQAGICILHAPLFHPAMKNIAPIRRELGVKTFFNILGPLVNPTFPKFQLTGVFNLELARLYNYLLQKTETQFTILYALDGYDEISLTGSTKVFSNKREEILTPQDFDVRQLNAEEIIGGDTVTSSAKIFMDVIQNNGTEAQTNVVCANAGMAIATALNLSPIEGFEKAKESLFNRNALKALTTLQNLNST
ncbi:anthranilate phosphoribosyltransferase [Flavobacteriaceae bacterium]|jgi:anthranilate phosphoribosyltransferase|nr:anthranilate phosphoribosyltransferase [Flavobacteriaceae bacterium]MDC1377945.1 anthranilate phosphoribosyltransferase [Flavobacteriaceae bacterium]|tara:strand:+ start:2259 stop:3254 length:996 start_codon:yes stop_codon:yes gene_type:complete